MPSNYPGSPSSSPTVAPDVFTEPGTPESTSLSSKGSGNKTHYEHHRDLGDAVEKIELYASTRSHTHDGTDTRFGGPKLDAANTHQNVTLDTAGAIHHTLGTGAFQAAAGNHNHEYNSLLNIPFKICATNADRPGSPTTGTMIYDSATRQFRMWQNNRWALLPMSNIPYLRARQNKQQTISTSGTPIEWNAKDAGDDPFGYLTLNTANNNTNATIQIKEPGLYHIDAAVQWHQNWVPEVATVVLLQNNNETTIRNQSFLRSALYTPGFSQTLSVSGKLRFNENDTLVVRAKYSGGNIFTQVLSFFEPGSQISSRIELVYLAP